MLIADAAAALIDHVRYGRVRPASLDKRWNVDPRVGAPPLDLALEDLARAAVLDVAIESKKPTHFIYTGLKQALARMRAVAKAGGWPAVAAGTTAIKPGAKDPRVAMIRKRLLVTGELASATSVEDTVYDADLQAAVKSFQAHHRLTDDGVIGKATIDAMNVTAEARVQQLRVNLERARWVVGGLSDSFVLVNLPAFKAYVIRDRKNVWETRTQIGREARQTPTFRADMKYLVLNPDWTVPPTILAQDVLAGMRKGQNTIAKKRLDDSRSAGPRRRSGVDRLAERHAAGTSATRCVSRPAPTTRSDGSSSSSRTSTRSSCTTRPAASCSPPTSARSARAASASSVRSTWRPSCSKGRRTGPRRAFRRSSTRSNRRPCS